jgi:hypothetical protein
MASAQEGARASEAAVTEALERVVARHGDRPPTLLEELLEWVAGRFGFEAAPVVWEGVFWIFLAALVVGVVVFALRFLQAGWGGRLRAGRVAGEEGPSVAERVARLRREASAARAAGDLRLALRKQLFALVLGLGGRGDLEYRDAWTNRELVDRGKPSPDVRGLLSPLVLELEAKEFGRVPVLPGDVDRLEGLCARYLGEAP